jgi:hypothetical protein
MRSYLFAIFLSLITPSLLAAITTHIEPSTVSQGESFRLTLTLDNVASSGIPDLIALQQHFNIDATEHSVSTNIINGNVSTVNQWVIVLTPKKTGTLAIPSIKIGTEQSTPSQITVTKNTTTKSTHAPKTFSSQQSSQKDDAISVQVDVDTKTPYLHQQVVYTVKLLHRGQLLDASYQPPRMEDTLMMPLGNSREYQVSQQGELYTVEEQRYALFPQKTGEQLLEGPTFQALVYNGMPKRMHATAKPTQFTVNPAPSSYKGAHWLPAKRITLSEHYDKIALKYKEGNTLIRTITLEGVGVPAELLPTLSANPRTSFGVYPEKPALNNTLHKQNIVGTKTIQITYLLNQPGKITLPAYNLAWFNTTTGQEEHVTLPAHTLTVTALPPIHKTSKALVPKKAIATTPKKPSEPFHRAYLPWIIALLFALAWLITMLKPYYKRKQLSITTKPKRGKLSMIHQGCLERDPLKTQAAILHWARTKWPHASIKHLQEVISLINHDALAHELLKLSQALYDNRNTTWEGDHLWELIRHYRSKPSTKQTQSVLPSINPSHQGKA